MSSSRAEKSGLILTYIERDFMMRIIPKDEVAFKEKVDRHIKQFARDEGIAWFVVRDSKDIEEAIDIIASKFWYIKRNVKPDSMDIANMKKNVKIIKEKL